MPALARNLPCDAAPAGDLLTVQVTVERIRFQKGAFTIATVAPSSPLPPPLGDGRSPSPLAVKGEWPGVARGLAYTLQGRVECDPKFGFQLALDPDRPPALVEPSDADGLVRLLAAEDVTHLGPVLAEKVVARFGVEETLRILSDEPAKLAEVKGISLRYAEQCAEAWKRLRESQVNPETRRALYKHGLTRWQVSRLVSEYGNDAPRVVRDEPYRLVEIDGFGFLRADTIARRAGMGADDPRRVRAAVLHVLQTLGEEGHTEAPADVVVSLVRMKHVRAGGRKLDGLGIDVAEDVVQAAVGRLVERGAVRQGVAGRLALRALREAEETTAKGLLGLMK